MTDLNVGTKLCTNCKQNINLASFLMHEPFCFKNNVICPSCDNVYNKNQKDDHFEEYHAPIACECGESIEKMHIDKHKLETCRKRQKNCFYCELSLDADQYDNHIEFCGNRTELCPSCSRYIKIKDQNRHEDSNCAFPEPVVTKPTARSVPINSRPLPTMTNDRFNSARSLDKHYLNQFNREMSMTLIPCEFCNDFFGSSELLKHQNICDLNPTLARYQPLNQQLNEPLTANNLNDLINSNLVISPERAHNGSAGNDNNDSITNKIPCEFCNKLFDFDDILMHETGCEVTSNAADDSDINRALNEYEQTKKPQIRAQGKASTSQASSTSSIRSGIKSKSLISSNQITSKLEPATRLRVKREKSPFFNSFDAENSPIKPPAKLNTTTKKFSVITDRSLPGIVIEKSVKPTTRSTIPSTSTRRTSQQSTTSDKQTVQPLAQRNSRNLSSQRTATTSGAAKTLLTRPKKPT